MFEHLAKKFVDELCNLLNENSERLKEAWKISVEAETKGKQNEDER